MRCLARTRHSARGVTTLGEKMRRATLGFAPADLALVGCIHGAMVRQGNPINGHPTSPFTQVLGNQFGPEIVEMALECIEITELAGQVAQHGRPRGSTFKLVTGWVYRQPGGGSTDQHPPQVTTFNSPGHLQRQGVERVDGKRVHVSALPGKMRIGRHGDSPVVLRELDSSSRYRRVPYFL